MSMFMVFAALVACVDGEPKDDSGTPGTTTTPDSIAVNGLQITCSADETTVTLSPSIDGAPASAQVNMQDFANASNAHEENLFTFDASGNIEDLTLNVDGMDTIFTCPDHFSQASAVMSYAVFAYDAMDTLADCAAGSESGEAQAFLDNMGMADGGAPPTNAAEWASCSTDLALSY